MQNWNRYIPQLIESPHWFFGLGSEGYHSEKGQIEGTRNASTQENSIWKAILHSWRVAEISATNMEFKVAGMVILIIIPIRLAYSDCEDDKWILENDNRLL